MARRQWRGCRSEDLREGLEETLAVTKLGLSSTPRKSLATTNMLENLNLSIRRVTRNLKRWRGRDMRRRWVRLAIAEAAIRFHRIKGHGRFQSCSALFASRSLAHLRLPCFLAVLASVDEMLHSAIMIELVEKAGIKREPGYLYLVSGSSVMRTKMVVATPETEEGEAELIWRGSFVRDPGYQYFLDARGDISRAPREEECGPKHED